MNKMKNKLYFMVVLAGFSWFFRDGIVTEPIVASDSGVCQVQSFEAQYINESPQHESDDLFVSCGGFL